MAEKDETSKRRRRIDSKKDSQGHASSHQEIVWAQVVNGTPAWYLRGAHYEKRNKNALGPVYYCGKEIFEALADSIEKAEKSVDIIMWGFDPAMPLRRPKGTYKPYKVKETIKTDKGTVTYREVTYTYWRKEDAYGEILRRALKNNPNLKIRIVLWYNTIAFKFSPNVVGFTGHTALQTIPTPFAEKDSGIPKGAMKESRFKVKLRHPEASLYSKKWFQEIVWRKKEFPEWNRLSIVLRSINNHKIDDEEDKRGPGESATLSFPTDHQKMVLIDYEHTDNKKRYGYVMGHNSITQYWSDFPFVHQEERGEMNYTPYHDFSIRVSGPLLADMNENFCDAWCHHRGLAAATIPLTKFVNRAKALEDAAKQATGTILVSKTAIVNPVPPPDRLGPLGNKPNPYATATLSDLDKEDPKAFRNARKALKKSVLATEAGQCSGQIVRTRPDHVFEGTKEQEIEIRDAYLQMTRNVSRYLLIINQYCQYPKLIRHAKYWWGRRKLAVDKSRRNNSDKKRAERMDVVRAIQYEEHSLSIYSAVYNHEKSAQCRKKIAELRKKQAELEKGIENLAKPAQQKIFILMGTCKPEQDGQVFAANQMANELGLGNQFTGVDLTGQTSVSKEVKEKALYDEEGRPINRSLWARLKQLDIKQLDNLKAAPKVTESELVNAGIYPMFFMFYTKAPQGEPAQHVYVHAKLMVQDDIWFTMGSANLNTRSMAVDSELNLISDNRAIAQEIRHKLFSDYSGKSTGTEFPNRPEDVLEVNEMMAIYKILKRLAEENLKDVKKRVPLKSHIVKFEDTRPATARVA
jgi:phosphatidylserine/phosphatidylglycerophosphate/cardiolipin synthase-like enzyme